MEWLEIKINLSEEDLDAASGVILSEGIPGVEIEDPRDFLEFASGAGAHWDYIDDGLCDAKKKSCFIKFYVTNNSDGEALCKRITDKLALSFEKSGVYKVYRAVLREEDWANSWKQYYKPFTVGSRLLVVPEWEEAPAGTGRTVFRCNPGMAFGSGSHATTRLCLAETDRLIKGGESVYDLGCGSGILSICAALLGAGRVFGIDIDKNAAAISEKNAALNLLPPERYLFTDGNILADQALIDRLAKEPADIVLANIVADVIIAALPKIKKFLKYAGYFIASGIIDERSEEVARAISVNGFEIEKKELSEGWVCITSVNKNPL